jgi:hypothetical protein
VDRRRLADGVPAIDPAAINLFPLFLKAKNKVLRFFPEPPRVKIEEWLKPSASERYPVPAASQIALEGT